MPDEEYCSLCHNLMTLGKALFTAGCTHTFHYMCIQEAYIRGKQLCPVCESKFDEPPVLLTDRTISADWYFGAINREQAEMLLLNANEEGTFLVRDSAQNNGQYCVSFLNDKVRHCRVYLNERGAYYLTTNRHSFNTIGELIDYYKSSYLTHAAGEDGVQPTLFKFTKPCPERFKALLTNPNARTDFTSANLSIPPQAMNHSNPAIPTSDSPNQPPQRYPSSGEPLQQSNVDPRRSVPFTRIAGAHPDSYDITPTNTPTSRRSAGIHTGMNTGTNASSTQPDINNEFGASVSRATTQPTLGADRVEALSNNENASPQHPQRMNPSNSSGPSYYQNNAIIASNTSINTIDSNYGSPNYHGATTQASTNAGPRSNESMDNTHRLDNVQIASEADKDWAEGRPYLNSGNIMRTPEYAEADVSSPDNRNISSDVR